MAHNVFTKTPVKRPKRNMFDLSHDVKLSFDMGELIPTLIQEVIPGDSFTIQNETLVRFAPMVAPVMHNINVHTHYFFVPNRITFPEWEKFISADLSKETPVTWPYIDITGEIPSGTLGDYLGLPTGVALGNVSALPFAAYQKVYDEYYRDQNLIESEWQELVPGLNSSAINNRLRKRAWMHDYFTSALPFAQKGPAVDLPIGQFDDVPVYKDTVAGGNSIWTDNFDEQVVVPNRDNFPEDEPDRQRLWAALSEVSEAGATTINDLRVAIRLQEWFEKAARGGSRYIEQIMVHFGVKSDDARLNRPEFLGGSRNKVIISEVLQTSSTDETSPQGDMAGHGISAAGSKRVRYFAKEHGYIIGITSITPTTAYQQGIPRHFSRTSWEEYAWPTFAHLGEQAVLNKELVATVDEELNEETFGYVPRYSEYRYTSSRVAGQFRDSLSFWHLGRIFETMPALNKQFIECNPRKDIFAVTDENEDSLWCHVFNKVRVKRKLPKYGSPTL